MKKSYSKSSRQGLPGGPNEMFQKVKGIIVSERGQWDFPGMTTLVPTQDGRITMQDVPYPVLGQDETGYTQMMYPEQEYQFPGRYVLELPMAQRGLQKTKLQPWEYLDEEGNLHTNTDKLPFDPMGRQKYAEELNWIGNWISKRRPQMQSAIQSYYDKKDEKYPIDAFLKKYITNPLFGKPYSYDLTNDWNITDEQLGKTILHNAQNNLKKLRFKDSSKISPGSYVPPAWGSYTPDGHHIYFYGEDPSDETKIHEIGHGTRLGSQKIFTSLIEDIIKNDELYKTKYDSYYHSPEEVYSRIWELRKGLDLKPTDKITKKNLKEKIQKINSDDALDIFRHLKVDTIIKLLNDLVYQEPASELPMAQRGGALPKFQNTGEKLPEQQVEEPKPFVLPKGKGYFFSETGETNLPKKLDRIEKRRLSRNDFQTEEDYVNFLTNKKSKFKDFDCTEDGCAEFANNRAGELVGLGGADYATWLRGAKYTIGAGGHAWQTYGNLLSLGGKSIFNNYRKQGDISQAKPGDIVGLRGNWSVYSSPRYDTSGENAPKAGVDNSHQGVVEYVDSKGNVYVRHNVNGTARVEKIEPTEKGYELDRSGWDIVTVARPNFEKYKYAPIKYRDEIKQYYVDPYISDYNPNKAVVFKGDYVIGANPMRVKSDFGNFMLGEQSQKIDQLTGKSNVEVFPVTEKSGNEDMQKFIDSLNDNKESLMDYYRLSDDEFNEIAKYAIATAGAESDFGTSSKLAFKNKVPNIARGIKTIRDQKIYSDEEMSKGIGQVKPYSLDEVFKQTFGLNKRNIVLPEKNALAVFSHLVDDTRKAKLWAERNKDLPEEVRTNYPFLGAAVYVNPYSVRSGNLTYDESFQNNPNKPFEPIGLDNQRLRIISDYLKDVDILDLSKLYKGQPLEEIKIIPQQKYGGVLPKAQPGLQVPIERPDALRVHMNIDPNAKYEEKKKSDVLDLDNALDYLVETRGGTRDLWGRMADTIGYHESWHTMDSLKLQSNNGPGRGIFQFEPPSLITAQNRYRRIADRLKLKTDPKILNAKSAIELSPEQQYALFLINIAESKAPLKDYADNKLSLVDLWLQGHKNVERVGNRESFRTSVQKAKNESIQKGYDSFKKLGGSLPKAQTLGQFNPQVFKPNPLTGQYSWEQKPIKKTNLTPKMQPAVRATTNVQRPGFNLDRDNRLLDAGLQNTNVSSNPLSPYVHTLLDAAGMVPILGEPADFANALLYNYEGDLENAATSTAGMIPILGMLGTGKRLLGKAGKGFKSKIDWGKWNPEIPNNKALMDEYLAIEQKAKADGTWMKNPDGTPSLMPDGSKPTPELWIQSQSKNWEKAYGKKGLDAINESYRGVGFSNSDPDFSKGFIEGDKAIFAADRNLANSYAWGPKIFEDMPVLTPNDPLGKSGVFHLMHPKGKIIDLNTLNSNWTNINLRGAASKSNIETSLNQLEDQLKIAKDLPKGVTRDNAIKHFKEKIDILKKNLEDFDKLETDPEALRELISEFPGRPATDEIAEWLPKTDINSIILRNINDGGLGNVTIFNNKFGKYAKSAVGNNGMFDMTNPNIYKALAPIMGLGAAGTYGANQLMNQQPESYKRGGSLPKAQNGEDLFPGEGMYYQIPEYTFDYKRRFSDLPTPRYTGPLMSQQLIDEATQREYEQRRRAIDESIAATRNPLSAERLAKESATTGDKLSLQMMFGDPYNSPRVYEALGGLDFINPAVMLGDMATGLGALPYNIQEGNYGSAALGLVSPLATGALASIGVKSPRGFINNLVNPFAGIGDTPRQIPGSPNAVSVVDDVSRVVADTPQPWQMQELPGLHLKSTMTEGPISKIVEPKTGLINTEQALAIIGKESGGADKVALIRQGLGENIPKKMDYNEFRKLVQDQLIPLERQFATRSSNYGIGRLGYPATKRSSHIEAQNYIDADILDLQKSIQDNVSQINKQKTIIDNAMKMGDENVHIKKKHLQLLEEKQKEYVDKIENLTMKRNKLQSELDDPNYFTLENQTIILGNKSKFGRGSSAHGNPEETLGHAHFLRDAETPDVLTVTQIQSDAFQGTHRTMPKSKESLLKDIETGWATDEGIENFTQKQLLDKNHQERFLQELVDYAASRGDINKMRLPTSETAAKVQNYDKIKPVTDPVEIAKIKRQIEAGKKRAAEAPTKDKEKWERGVRSLQLELNGGYEFQHQTILKKYSEQPKTIKKLFGKEPRIVTDSKGNTWYEFDIPEKFKQGKGEIKAYQHGGDTYNMQRALELGYTPDEIGHWPSVDSTNGMWLKSKQHPTAWMEYMHGYALNPENNRRFDVVPNVEGYFGDNQLQYVEKSQEYQIGGPLQTDPVLNFITQQQPRRFSKSKK